MYTKESKGVNELENSTDKRKVELGSEYTIPHRPLPYIMKSSLKTETLDVFVFQQ